MAASAGLSAFGDAGHGIRVGPLLHEKNPWVAVVAKKPVSVRIVGKYHIRHLSDGLNFNVKIERVDVRLVWIDRSLRLYLVFFKGLDPVDRSLAVFGKVLQHDLGVPIGSRVRRTRLRNLRRILILGRRGSRGRRCFLHLSAGINGQEEEQYNKVSPALT